EGGEEDVFRQHGRIRERVQQRALSRVRVPDDRDDRHARAVALPAASSAVGAQPVDAVLEVRDPVADATAVDLELRLARSAAADAAREAGQRIVAPDQARQAILELRQLDLQLAVRAPRTLREDVEDELRAIDDAQRGRLADVTGLRRGEIAIEDEQVSVEGHRAHEDLLQLAFTDERARIDLAPPLQDRVEDLDAGGARELAQLGHRILRGGARTGERAHQQGTSFAAHGTAGG